MEKRTILKIQNQSRTKIFIFEWNQTFKTATFLVPLTSLLGRKKRYWSTVKTGFNFIQKNLDLNGDFYYLEAEDGAVKATLEVDLFATILKVEHDYKEAFSFKNIKQAINFFIEEYTSKKSMIL